MVRVRMYEVNTAKLVELLRDSKKKVGLSNKFIAKQLGVPLTMVEHYFRCDKYSATPEPEIWHELKALLQISTNEFDAPITCFEMKRGGFESADRHYLSSGLCPTITSSNQFKIIEDKE